MFHGGGTPLIAPDNARARVWDDCRHEPKLNQTVRNLARHN